MTRQSRFRNASLIGIAGAALTLVAVVSVLAYAQAPGTRDRQNPYTTSSGNDAVSGRSASPRREKKMLVREGVRLQLTGRFHGGGVERYVFQPNDGKESYQVLENLALERVANIVNPGSREWTVTAEVTEYRNVNYLIIKKATVASSSQR